MGFWTDDQYEEDEATARCLPCHECKYFDESDGTCSYKNWRATDRYELGLMSNCLDRQWA